MHTSGLTESLSTLSEPTKQVEMSLVSGNGEVSLENADPEYVPSALQIQQSSIEYYPEGQEQGSPQERSLDCDNGDESIPFLESISHKRAPPPRMGKGTIWKNLLALSVSFTFVYTSYMSLQNLESSLNLSGGLGVTTLSCVFGGMCFSALYAPVLIRIVGTKYVIVMLFVAEGLFTVAHYNPSFYTLIPAAVLLGLISSPASAAGSVYVANIARKYASITEMKDAEPVIALFNGIYLAFFQATQITGNLVSSLVLESNNQSSKVENESAVCGAHFCPGDNVTGLQNFERPADHLVNILLSVFVACCIVGVLLMLLLVDRCRDLEKTAAGRRSLIEDILGTLTVHFHPWLACFTVLFFWSGTEQAFLYSEYTEAFVSCQIGISHVGYAMIGFGVGDVLGSVLFGRIEKFSGRIPLFIFAVVVNLTFFLVMLFWNPSQGPEALLYVIPFFWGLGDSVWQLIPVVLIGTEYPGVQDSAFAMFRMWQAAGFTVMFATSQFLCLDAKIYINLSLMVLASALYFLGEHGVRHSRSRPWRDIYVPIA